MARQLKKFYQWTFILSGLFFGVISMVQADDHKVKVIVSTPPQAFVVERIGGEHVSVSVMVQPGQNPAHYEPLPRQMEAVHHAKIYFSSGVPFEKNWLPRIKAVNKELKFVDVNAEVTLRDMVGHHHHDDHHHHDEHEMVSKDPHTWLDPMLVIQHSHQVVEALCEVEAVHCSEWRANQKLLKKQLHDLDQQLTNILTPVQGQTMLVFHPAWGYFCQAYGLKQKAIEVSGKKPSSRQLAHIYDEAAALGVRSVFVQQQFDQKLAKSLADQMDAQVIVLDPLAKDYISNMLAIAHAVAEGLKHDKD